MGRLALVVACVALLAPALAVADDDIEMDAEPAQPGKDPKLAKKWIETGHTLVQKGDAAIRAKKTDEATISYDNAITAFEKAIEAGNDANVYFDLASVEEKAGKLDRAATHYRALVKAQGARADLVKKAQARFDDLTSKTGLVTIITKPEGATITLEGKELGKTPLAEPLVLMPGTYTFKLAAPGHDAKDVEFKVEAGSESERTLELPVASEPPPPPPKQLRTEEPVETPVATPGPNKLPLYAGAGTAGGFVLIATITGIVAVSKHSTFEDKNASPQTREDAKSSGKTFALVTDLCLVGAVAAGGFTAYWYFAKYKPAQRKLAAEAAPKTALAPWVQPDAGGLVLAGSF